MIIAGNQLISEDIAKQIVDAGVETVTIRSVFTCNTKHGVCKHCYGRNLATGSDVEVGEAVGTIAAQSIGEPGTPVDNAYLPYRWERPETISLKVFLVSKKFLKRNPKKGNSDHRSNW